MPRAKKQEVKMLKIKLVKSPITYAKNQRDTLKALGFEVKRNDSDFEVKVPSYRATKDVTIKADIIEEITRIYNMYPGLSDDDFVKDILTK